MLQELMTARPVTGRRVRQTAAGEKLWFFLVEKLSVGEIVRVLPGEQIPLDGIIVKGATQVTTTVVDVEHKLEAKVVNDKVYCGTVNCGNEIDVRITATFAHSSLQHLIDEAKEIEAKKSFWQRTWEKIWHRPASLAN